MATRKIVKKRAGRKQAFAPSKAQKTKLQRPYPAKTLEEALVVPQVIREKNNGNPWATDDVSQAALGVSKNTTKFFYVAAAARDYGLTIGSRDTEKIELATLGREIVFAADSAIKRQKMIDSFFSVGIFKSVYDHYGSANLPESEFLSNVLLGEFGLSKELHDDFVAIFKANCKFLDIEVGIGDEVRISPRESQLSTEPRFVWWVSRRASSTERPL